MSMNEKEIIEVVEELNEQDDYEGIIRYVEALTDEERTPAVVSQLARAYNNYAQAGDYETLQKALDLLDSIDENDRDNYYWHFRKGYSLFFLDRMLECIPCFTKAMTYKECEDSQTFINWAWNGLVAETFYLPYSERVEKFWSDFYKEEEELRKLAESGFAGRSRAEERIKKLLKFASTDRWSIQVLMQDGRPHIVFSATSWYLTALTINELIRKAPPAVKKSWTLLFGQPPEESINGFSVSVDGTMIEASEIQFIIDNSDEEKGCVVHFFNEKLAQAAKRTQSDPSIISNALEIILKAAVGEAVQMRHLQRYVVHSPTSDAPCIPFAKFSETLFNEIPEAAELTMEKHLEDSKLQQLEPSEDKDCDVFMDLKEVESRLFALHNDYRSASRDSMVDLERIGATAGALFFAADAADEEKLKLRNKLEEHLVRTAGADNIACIGRGRGLKYEYVEFIAWNLKPILDSANQFFNEADAVSFAAFHSFLRETGSLIFKSKEESGQDGPEEKTE